MEIRNTVHPDDFKRYTTERIKKEFLVRNLFVPGEIKVVYTHFDRMIVGGVCPNKPIGLEGNKELRLEIPRETLIRSSVIFPYSAESGPNSEDPYAKASIRLAQAVGKPR